MYRRRLPHVYATHRPVFLTWRLHGSLPDCRGFDRSVLSSGKAFAAMDQLLDQACTGPFYLRQPQIADIVVESLFHHAEALLQYQLHAFVVMPNHVHALLTPAVPLPKLTKSLKSFTGRRANSLLGLSGQPFWQEETFDRTVRNDAEFGKIRTYIEENPVNAGLAIDPHDYKWSSAWAPGGRTAWSARDGHVPHSNP